MIEPEWVEQDVVIATHDAQLAEHGGLPGIRDQNALLSTLDRPRNHYNYKSASSVVHLAAIYTSGLATGHCFHDGNKRTAWVVCVVFLEINGFTVSASEEDVVAIMQGIAAGKIVQEQFMKWLENNVQITNAVPGAAC